MRAPRPADFPRCFDLRLLRYFVIASLKTEVSL